ncbi:MAG: MerR family transcriptional regulator [Pseudonocardiaceae bacterium]
MSRTDGKTWKVGQLARLTGLTVRTLHHYDALGLLRPSARTPSGHRLYDEDDVRRLYRVVAMRELGLTLDMIGHLLTGEPDLADLLRDHLAHVDRHAENSALLQRDVGGPSPELIDYIRRANAAAGSSV